MNINPGLIVNPSWRGQTLDNNYTELHHTCHIRICRPKPMHKTKCEQAVTIFNISFVFLLSCLPGVSFCTARPFRFPVSSLGTPATVVMYNVPANRQKFIPKSICDNDFDSLTWIRIGSDTLPAVVVHPPRMSESGLHVSHLTCPKNLCCGVY